MIGCGDESERFHNRHGILPDINFAIWRWLCDKFDWHSHGYHGSRVGRWLQFLGDIGRVIMPAIAKGWSGRAAGVPQAQAMAFWFHGGKSNGVNRPCCA